MQVKLKRVGECRFEAENERGQKAMLDGPPDIGGEDLGVRPMEMVLMGLAGCSAVDVLHILKKGRQVIDDLEIVVDASRVDAIPAVFEKINLHFSATEKSGKLSEEKLARAVALSMEKYCSVAMMLNTTVEISHSCELKTN